MISYILGTSQVQGVNDTLRTRDEILYIQDNMILAQNKIKQQEYHHCYECCFESESE